MHFQVKMRENGKNNIFRDKQTRKKIPLKFLDVNVITIIIIIIIIIIISFILTKKLVFSKPYLQC